MATHGRLLRLAGLSPRRGRGPHRADLGPVIDAVLPTEIPDTAAAFKGATIENGDVADRNPAAFTPLQMIDTPDMEIAFVDRAEVPVGLGEPGPW